MLLRVLPAHVLLQILYARQHVLSCLLYCIGRLLAFEILVQLAFMGMVSAGYVAAWILWLVFSAAEKSKSASAWKDKACNHL